MAGKYDAIVYDYFEKANGSIILISEDPLFKRMLSSTTVSYTHLTLPTKRIV